MQDNKQYHFLHSFIKDKDPAPFQAQVVTSKESGKSFVKIPLSRSSIHGSLPMCLTDGNYNFKPIEDTHITFFEKINPSNLTLGEYHYTAYFSDSSHPGSYFQLHVYFNNQDQPVIVQLSEHKADSFYRFVPLGETDKASFQSLALHHMHETMSVIRSSFNQQVQEDKERYDTMEAVLDELSKDMKKNVSSYTDEITRQVQFLDEIARYHSNQKHWTGIRDILSGVKAQIQTDNFVHEHKDSPEPTPEFLTIHIDTPVDIPAPSIKPAKQALSVLVEPAEEAMRLFEGTVQSASIRERVDLLSYAMQLTQEANIFFTETTYKKSSKDLLKLQHLLSLQQHHREQLLIQLLKDGHLTLAKALLGNQTEGRYVVSHDIDCELVRFALEEGKPELLAFMLKNSDFPINTFTMPGQTGNVTAAMYCFLTGTASAGACLSVLIEHNASLMETYPNTGLPLAHSLLGLPSEHPCVLALKNNNAKTLSAPSFFIQMICHLKTLPESPEAMAAIRTYEGALAVLNQQKNKDSIDSLQRLNAYNAIEALVKNPRISNHPNFIQLLSDPDLRIISEELQLYLDAYVAKTNKSKIKLPILQSYTTGLHLLNASPEYFDQPFAELKKLLLEPMQKTLEAFKYCEQNMTKVPITGGMFQTKKDKKLIQRQMRDLAIKTEEQRQKKRAHNTVTGLTNAIDKLQETLNASTLTLFGNTVSSTSKPIARASAKDLTTLTAADPRNILDKLDALSETCDAIIAELTKPNPEYSECDRDDDDRMRPTF